MVDLRQDNAPLWRLCKLDADRTFLDDLMGFPSESEILSHYGPGIFILMQCDDKTREPIPGKERIVHIVPRPTN